MRRLKSIPLVVCGGVLLLSGCPQPLLQDSVTEGELPTKESTLKIGDQVGATAHTLGVRWPSGGGWSVQAMPPETKSVTFHISKGEVPTQVFTLIREPGSETASRSVMLFPGEYIVRVRAFGTDSPKDESPVLASGARSFSVTEGQDPQTVVIILTIHPSPAPEPALPSPAPSNPPETQPSPSPAPTPSATPTTSPTSRPSTVTALIQPGITFNDSYFVDFLSGWVIGLNGRVRRTLDGGVTWSSHDIPGAGELYSVFFLDRNQGWVGDRRYVYRTGDGGSTWTRLAEVLPNESPSIWGLHFQDAQNGYCVLTTNTGGGLFVTRDGGQSWSRAATGYFKSLSGIPNETVFISEGGKIPTSSSGPTWRYRKGGLTQVLGEPVEFIGSPFTSPQVVVSTYSDTLLKSIDGGLTWQSIPFQIQGSASSSGIQEWGGVAMLSESHGLGLHWSGSRFNCELVETLDGGLSWTVISRPSLSYPDYNEHPFTRPRFFAFNGKSAWHAYADNTRLLRIGEP